MHFLAVALTAILLLPASAEMCYAASDGDRIQKLEKRLSALERFRFSGYLQGRFQDNLGSSSVTDDFFVRRARLKLTVKPSSEVAAIVSFDGAKGFELKDAYVVYVPGGSPQNAPAFWFGQMNWPFGREVPVSSSARECPERALFARSLFPGERDLGFKIVTETGHNTQLELGVYNGTGLNKRDTNDGKDLVGRLAMDLGDRVDAGVSGYWGTALVEGRSLVKNRFGADAVCVLPNGLVLKAEGVYARERGNNPWGYLVQLAQNFGPKNVLVLRFDAYDHDGLSDARRTHTLNVGLVRHLTPNLKGKIFWENPKDKVGDVSDDRVIAEILAVF